jgi:hypothetical protein
MDKDEVIALAEKCKLAVLIHSQWTHEIKEFTVVDYVVEGDLGSLMQFAKLVAEHEREACAEVCKKHADFYAGLEPSPIAQSAWAACIDNRDTILARGQA